MPARASAWREASTGPRPMISGERRADAGRDDPGERRRGPSSRGLGVAHDDEGGGAVVERAAVAGGDRALLAEHRLQGLDTPSSVTPARGPSSVLTTVPSGVVIGVISRSKKPSAMAFSARFWLRDAPLVLALAGDAPQAWRRSRRSGPSRCRCRAAGRPRGGRSTSSLLAAVPRAAGLGLGEPAGSARRPWTPPAPAKSV